MSDTPAYRLFTSQEAAERVGGDLTASLFDRLATSGKVEFTLIGGKVRWTDHQIGLAVAHHAKQPKAQQQAPAATPEPTRGTRSAPAARMPGGVTRLTAKPGRRYSQANSA